MENSTTERDFMLWPPAVGGMPQLGGDLRGAIPADEGARMTAPEGGI